MAAAVTRAEARKRGNSKPPKVKEMTLKIAVDKEKLVRLQEDSMLKKFKAKRKRYRIAYEKRGGIRCRIRERKNEVGDTRKVLVPKSLKESNESGSRFFLWRTFGSEENGGQDPH